MECSIFQEENSAPGFTAQVRIHCSRCFNLCVKVWKTRGMCCTLKHCICSCDHSADGKLRQTQVISAALFHFSSCRISWCCEYFYFCPYNSNLWWKIWEHLEWDRLETLYLHNLMCRISFHFRRTHSAFGEYFYIFLLYLKKCNPLKVLLPTPNFSTIGALWRIKMLCDELLSFTRI